MSTTRFLAHFTDAIAALRPDWDAHGIRAALRTSLDTHGTHGTHGTHATAAAMLRRAANPNNRTPALQPQDHLAPTVRCPVGAGAYPHGRCAGCHGETSEPLHGPNEVTWTWADPPYTSGLMNVAASMQPQPTQQEGS